MLVGDVTGEGVPDLLVGAELSDHVGIGVDAGAIYIWSGGPTAVGNPFPVAVLRNPDGFDHEPIGHTESGVGFQLVDAEGDGVLDVIAGAMLADVGPALDAGRVLYWRVAPTLAGIVAPTAILNRPAPVAGDQLGMVGRASQFLFSGGEGILLAELTGADALDLVAGAVSADLPLTSATPWGPKGPHEGGWLERHSRHPTCSAMPA